MNTLEEKFRSLLVNLQATVCRQHTTKATVRFHPCPSGTQSNRPSIGMWHMCHMEGRSVCSVKARVVSWIINCRGRAHGSNLDLGWTFVLDFNAHLFFWRTR